MTNLVNYHAHSCYSFLDGLSKPKEMAERCKELGMEFCMVTDHGNVAAHLAHKNACEEVGIKPILGTELYLKDDRYDNGRAKGYHLLLWAYNTEGLRNIWAISSNTYYATEDDHRTPNTRWEHMEGRGAGVVCSSACLASMLSEAARNNDYEQADYFVNKCQSIFDEFAIELHVNSEEGQHAVNIWLVNYAKSRHIPVVYSVDSHYTMPDDSEFHDVWLGCSTKSYYDEQHWTMRHEYYIHDEHEIRAKLAYLGSEVVDECFENVGRLLSLVEPYELDNSHKVPRFEIPDGFTSSNEYLRQLAIKGLLEKVMGYQTEWRGNVIGVISDDLEHPPLHELERRARVLNDIELPIVYDNGLADYFLMVADYVNYAKQHMLVGPGRGSAAGSLLCYCLGITTIDPTDKGLIFERFLNQGRLGTWSVKVRGSISEHERDYEFGEFAVLMVDGKETPIKDVKIGDSVECQCRWDGSVVPVGGTVVEKSFRAGELPDIDVDFEDVGKDLVHSYLREKYGEDKVTAVGTITFFGIKLAIKEMCRYYRIPVPESNRLTSIVEQLEGIAGKSGYWRDCLGEIDEADAEFVRKHEKSFPKLFEYAEKMVGLCRQPGKHAAGYVISPVSLAEWLPIRKVCQGNGSYEIIAQFDKYQIEDLGFVKADILGLRNLHTLRLAADIVKERKAIDIDFYSLGENDANDILWEQFDVGKTLGIFQMEGKGITNVGMAIRPRSISDISTILALYRPAVIGAGMLDGYIAKASGVEDVDYVDDSLEPILSDTYGVMVFQEQTMRVFTDLADFTPAQADRIRAAIGHKKIDQIDAIKPQYYAGCERHGVSREAADEILSWVYACGNYQFNRAHSYAYGTVAFWTAWMKANYPIEFYAASMTTVNDDAVPSYIAEARRCGIKVMPPTISDVSYGYKVITDDEISFGLIKVKGCGSKAVEKIVSNAPYSDFADFVDRSGANSGQIKTLIDGNFFRDIYDNARDLKFRYEASDFRETLFGPSLSQEGRMTNEHVGYPLDRVVELETEIYGMPLSVDPFEPYKARIGDVELMTAEDMNALGYGYMAVVLAKVVQVRKHESKRGQMAFIKISTCYQDQIDVTVFHKTWLAAAQWLKVGKVSVFGIMKSEYKGRASWHLEKLAHLDD